MELGTDAIPQIEGRGPNINVIGALDRCRLAGGLVECARRWCLTLAVARAAEGSLPWLTCGNGIDEAVSEDKLT
jgi:hypothetical protein